MTKTESIIDLIQRLQNEELPHEVVETVKGCVLDYLGVCMAGAFELRDRINNYLETKPFFSAEASIIGTDKKASIEDAALLNGIAAHFFELDDGSRYGMVHLGAPILSALFPIVEAFKVSSETFIKAVLVGYEVTIRLAAAIQPSHKKRGFHATGTCGCIGAAVAIATALKFDIKALKNTISAAVACASGLLEMIQDTSQLKPFNAGKAAQNAITSAFVGISGFSGPLDPIGGDRGFIKVMTESFDPSWFNRESDKQYTILSIYKKPYASCRHCHSAVEAALAISDKLQLDEIDHIDVFTYSLAVVGHDHSVISSVGSAKMSIPYSVAAAICLKTGGMESMSESMIKRKDILELARKVRVVEKEDFSVLVPAKRIAEVVLYLKTGETLCKKVIYPKGEPENPMNAQELRNKFIQLAKYAQKDDDYCDQVIYRVENIEQSIQALIQIL